MSREIAHAAEQRISRLLAMPDVAIKANRTTGQPPEAESRWPLPELQGDRKETQNEPILFDGLAFGPRSSTTYRVDNSQTFGEKGGSAAYVNQFVFLMFLLTIAWV